MSKPLDPNTLLGALLLAAVFLAAGAFFSWVVRRLIHAALDYDRTERIDRITLSFLSHLAVLALWILLATTYAHLVPALNKLGTTLLAGVSLISIIVGFAAQTTLGNLIAGIGLVFHKPFRRGDRIQIAAPTASEFEVGMVEEISLGYTVLRTDDGRQVVIANGTMAQQTIVRLGMPAQASENSRGDEPPQNPTKGR